MSKLYPNSRKSRPLLSGHISLPNSPSQIFRAIHNAYIGYLSNPFSAAAGETPTSMAGPIRSKRFTKAIRTIAGVDDAKERE